MVIIIQYLKGSQFKTQPRLLTPLPDSPHPLHPPTQYLSRNGTQSKWWGPKSHVHTRKHLWYQRWLIKSQHLTQVGALDSFYLRFKNQSKLEARTHQHEWRILEWRFIDLCCSSPQSWPGSQFWVFLHGWVSDSTIWCALWQFYIVITSCICLTLYKGPQKCKWYQTF